MLKITDTSHWKGRINFQEFKNNDVEANIAKATEGTSFIDSEFYPSVENMNSVDMLWGAYHYFRHYLDSKLQAKHFYNVAKETQLPPIIDVEKINNLGLSRTLFTDKLKVMVDETSQLFGRKPWIYTGYYTWIELTTCPLWAKDYELWLARYTSLPPSSSQIPKPWTNYILWQYTDREKVGTVYPLDANKFFGTREELYALAKNVTPPKTLEQRVKELEDRVTKLENLLTPTKIEYVDLGNGFAEVNKIYPT